MVPTDLHDDYAQALNLLVDTLAAGRTAEPPLEPQPPVDLMAALEESVRDARRARNGGHIRLFDPAVRARRMSAVTALTLQEIDQPRFRTCKPFPLLREQRSEGVDEDLLPGDVHHVAGVDPAAGTPGESDAPLEHGGLGGMATVLVGADGRSAGGADSSVSLGDRVPGPDFEPALPPGRCSSSRHAEHSLPRRVVRSGRGAGGRQGEAQGPCFEGRRV